MNLFKRNMFGELNIVCYLFGHNFCFIGKYPYQAVCQRCELDNPKREKELEIK